MLAEVSVISKGLQQFKVGSTPQDYAQALEYRTASMARLTALMLEAENLARTKEVEIMKADPDLAEWKFKVIVADTIEARLLAAIKTLIASVKIECQNIRQLLIESESERRLQ